MECRGLLFGLIVVFVGLEECVAQGDIGNVRNLRVVQNFGINEEKHRHIHSLPGKEALFFEAKTLDFHPE